MLNNRRITILIAVVAILLAGVFLGLRALGGSGLHGSFSVAFSDYDTVPLIVGLNDATGYFHGDPITLAPKDKQVIGTYSGNAGNGTYDLSVPQNPEGRPVDLTGGNNPSSAVHSYEVRL